MLSQMYISSVAYTTARPSSWCLSLEASASLWSGSVLLLVAASTGTSALEVAAVEGAAALRRASATACLLARSSACRHPFLRPFPWQLLPDKAQ